MKPIAYILLKSEYNTSHNLTVMRSIVLPDLWPNLGSILGWFPLEKGQNMWKTGVRKWSI